MDSILSPAKGLPAPSFAEHPRRRAAQVYPVIAAADGGVSEFCTTN